MHTPRLLFINGFHRSGTTVVTSAVTDAAGGVTTTVGSLAPHIPTLDAFLNSLESGAADRGADRLKVTPDTPEEYGFLLRAVTGRQALYAHPQGRSLLQRHIEELAANAPGCTVVLKNPWDVGHEARILNDFPEARVIILRRRLADIELSVAKALQRSASSPYSRALNGDSDEYRRLQRQLMSQPRRRLLLRALAVATRWRAYRLAGSVRALPPDRIALLSYDELRADPERGASWAAHLLDPHALTEAFARHAFEEPGIHAQASAMQRALDHRVRDAWAKGRAAQARNGIVGEPRSWRAPATRSAGSADREMLPLRNSFSTPMP